MSRLTGSDALGLFEAYQAVYNPQQYTEDQLWEEVEYWVDNLMREGYDLSDYTWEEMYETYNYYNTIVCYLLDEGYADTNENALVIMANMSEEWRQTILSEDPVQDYRDMKRANQNAAGMRGPELSHSSKGPWSSTKTTYMSPGSATQKPQPRSREFEKVLPGTSKPRGREFTNPPS